MHGVKILHLSIHHHRFMKMCKNVEENIYYGNKHFYILLITSIDFTYIIISPTHPPHQVKNIELSTILKTLIPNEFL